MHKRHTILVVDDEADVVKSVQDLLRLDYRVLGTTSPAEAVDILSREVVHVVMTDQRMPGMTGVELLKRVRGEHPDAVRLLFTGYADVRAVVEAINQGSVYRYITKPWDPDELVATLREACERYDLIVARKELTQALEQKNAELAKTIDKLAATNAELKQANTLKQVFIQVASHELRTPLAILLGLVSLAQTPAAMLPVGECLERIRLAAERLSYLIEQIVEMLHAGHFDQVLQRTSTDLAGLLRQAADDVRPFAIRRKQDLIVTIPDDLGTVEVDAAKIRDSINHLLLNAIKFTPDGRKITLTAAGESDSVKIEVIDEGVGLDTATMQRLFQPFFTGFDALHHASGQFEFRRQGLGLGLSIARAFIEMHRGKISASSVPGNGSTFTISLPRS